MAAQTHGPNQGRLVCRGFWLVALILWGRPGLALDPQLRLSQYIHQVWNNDKGLPQNAAQTVLQGRDGLLWIGTQEGLVRFDGARFDTFNRMTTPGLTHSDIRAILEDGDGSLWLATFTGGLAHFQGGRARMYTTAQGLPDNSPLCLLKDAAGRIWVGTSRGLAVLDSRDAGAFRVPAALKDRPVRSLLAGTGGEVWVGTGDGVLYSFPAGNLEQPQERYREPGQAFTALYREADGGLWIGSTPGGILRWKGRVEQRIPAQETTALVKDRHGSLWAGTLGGLLRIRGTQTERWGASEGLLDDFIWSVFEDREGNLWVGTSTGGLHRYTEGKVTCIGSREGLAGDYVRPILADAKGRLWVGTYGQGLSVLEKGVWRQISVAQGLSNANVRTLAEDAQGRIWVGTLDGLNCIEQGRVRRFGPQDGLQGREVWALHWDRQGSLWIATNEAALHQWRGGDPRQATVLRAPFRQTIRCLLEDREGSLWLGTQGDGLYRMKAGRFTRFSQDQGNLANTIICLTEDPKGEGLWVGSVDAGIFLIQGQTVTRLEQDDGLPDNSAFAIQDDGLGHFWMTSNRGLWRVARQELLARLRDRQAPLRPFLLGLPDGLRTVEFNGAWPSSCRTPDGRLWFPTIRGLVRVDPKAFRIDSSRVPLVMAELTVNGGKPIPAQGTPILNPGVQQLELRYAALGFQGVERIRFRYRIEDLEKEWVEAGTRRTAWYTHLPPGHHAFLFEACNGDGQWSGEAPARFEFVIRPFFYQTWAFYALCGTLAVLAGAGTQRFRQRKLKARAQELEWRVADRTKALEEAQARILRLSERASGLRDPLAWAQALEEELRPALGGARLAVWRWDGAAFHPMVSGGLAPTPDLVHRLRGGFLEEAGRTFIPVHGPGGNLIAMLTVDGKAGPWKDAERRMVAIFASHLAGALELAQLREELAQADARRAEARQALLEQGAPALQVCPVCGQCFDHTLETCPEDGSPLEFSQVFPYRVASRYRLTRFLGEGATAQVFEAEDERLGRRVALKAIKPEHFHHEHARLRFEKEARALAQLAHPSVLAIFDSGEMPDGTVYLVTERLMGASLGRLLKTFGPGRPEQVAQLLRDAGSALDTAHAAGLLHRDLKPDNIFALPSPLHFKLLDFGLAKEVEVDSDLTQAGIVMGTPVYMSPEQIEGHALDSRSDLYSLALVAWEALTGVRVVQGEALADIILHILESQPPPVRDYLPDLPPEVDAIFLKAFAKFPWHRPAHCGDWAQDLANLLEGCPSNLAGWPTDLAIMSQATSTLLAPSGDEPTRPISAPSEFA